MDSINKLWFTTLIADAKLHGALSNADAYAWASAIALWNQGPAELKMVQTPSLLGTHALGYKFDSAA